MTRRSLRPCAGPHGGRRELRVQPRIIAFRSSEPASRRKPVPGRSKRGLPDLRRNRAAGGPPCDRGRWRRLGRRTHWHRGGFAGVRSGVRRAHAPPVALLLRPQPAQRSRAAVAEGRRRHECGWRRAARNDPPERDQLLGADRRDRQSPVFAGARSGVLAGAHAVPCPRRVPQCDRARIPAAVLRGVDPERRFAGRAWLARSALFRAGQCAGAAAAAAGRAGRTLAVDPRDRRLHHRRDDRPGAADAGHRQRRPAVERRRAVPAGDGGDPAQRAGRSGAAAEGGGRAGGAAEPDRDGAAPAHPVDECAAGADLPGVRPRDAAWLDRDRPEPRLSSSAAEARRRAGRQFRGPRDRGDAAAAQ